MTSVVNATMVDAVLSFRLHVCLQISPPPPIILFPDYSPSIKPVLVVLVASLVLLTKNRRKFVVTSV